jgi:hypothetical protein
VFLARVPKIAWRNLLKLRHAVIFINKSDNDEKVSFFPAPGSPALLGAGERVFPGVGETPCTERGWERGKGKPRKKMLEGIFTFQF